MRQLLQEDWMHDMVRNAVALFLTRDDLWLSWEKGAKHFYDHLVDSDWAVNAGNWMWVSIAAFDRLLDCSRNMFSPHRSGRLWKTAGTTRGLNSSLRPRMAHFQVDYIHKPWKQATIQVQITANCIVISSPLVSFYKREDS